MLTDLERHTLDELVKHQKKRKISMQTPYRAVYVIDQRRNLVVNIYCRDVNKGLLLENKVLHFTGDACF